MRLQGYDYSNPGYYFITICSKNRNRIFSFIIKEPLPVRGRQAAPQLGDSPSSPVEIKLTIPGEIIKKEWEDIPNYYSHISLDEFVIMPDHIHGILHLNQRQTSNEQTISAIIRSFKSRVSNTYLKYIYKNNLNVSAKIWQRSFHDHIIRNEKALIVIRKYIKNNPEKW